MTIPMEYAHAGEAFDRFIERVRRRADHVTRHQTFKTVQSVLMVFRRRLTVDQALTFADALPVILRAVFVEGLRQAPTIPFASLTEMNAEVRAIREQHDFSPENAIEIVAECLREDWDQLTFHSVLCELPEGAAAFWAARHES